MKTFLIQSWGRFKCSKGALLIEALLAVSIVSVSLTMIIQSFLTSMRATAYSRDYTTAVMLIENEMFEIKRLGYADALTKTGGGYQEPFEQFQYAINSEPLGSQEEETLIEIQVAVTWPSGNKEKILSSSTLMMSSKEKENEKKSGLFFN